MAEVSAISWTDATFNPWIGCTEVSVGPKGACVGCYARTLMQDRYGRAKWGPGEPRARTSAANWKQPLRWNRQAAERGKPLRVFCSSLADVFDNEVPQAWRDDLWALIRETPNLRWMLLTKRIGNAPKMLPGDWPYPNAGLGSTIVTQAEWDRDYPKLAAVPASFHFVSDEPTLDYIDIGDARPDWIITGGESGPGFRPLDMSIVRHMRDQCARNGITFHHKQNGGLRGKDTGCLVDGVEHKRFPPALAA
jgi:protein gp37